MGRGLRPFAVIGREASSVFVDGRYTLEAQQFFEGTPISVSDLSKKSFQAWLDQQDSIARVTLDGTLLTAKELQTFERIVKRSKRASLDRNFDFYKFVTNDQRLVNNSAPVTLLGNEADDVSPITKRELILKALRQAKCQLYVTTNNEEVSWLLNLRAQENPFLPCSNCWFAISTSHSAFLYFPGQADLLRNVQGRLREMSVKVVYDFDSWIEDFSNHGGPVLIDDTRLNSAVALRLSERSIGTLHRASTIPLHMSTKSRGEIQASIAAHLTDGIAKTRFLHQLHNGGIAENNEYRANALLENIRRGSPSYKGPSFPWVSCVGPNAAKPHYKPKSDDCLPITEGSVFLIDSGGQYPGATTDVTRTVYVGDPAGADPEFRTHFTIVLKAFIRAISCRLPKRVTAGQLDAIARSALWSKGLDFGHGTGHGVGAGLSIHETPIVISGRANNFRLKPRMIFSIEPGYYEKGRWGISNRASLAIRSTKEKGGAGGMMQLDR